MGTDRITDQSLTVLECRVLLEIFSSGALPAGKILRQLKQKAVRGAAMETPSETRERHNND